MNSTSTSESNADILDNIYVSSPFASVSSTKVAVQAIVSVAMLATSALGIHCIMEWNGEARGPFWKRVQFRTLSKLKQLVSRIIVADFLASGKKDISLSTNTFLSNHNHDDHDDHSSLGPKTSNNILVFYVPSVFLPINTLIWYIFHTLRTFTLYLAVPLAANTIILLLLVATAHPSAATLFYPTINKITLISAIPSILRVVQNMTMLLYFGPVFMYTNSQVWSIPLILAVDITVAIYMLILVAVLVYLYTTLLSTTSTILLETKTPRDALKTSKWVVTTNLASRLVPLLILVISLFLINDLLDVLQYFIPASSTSLIWATDYIYWLSILPNAGLGVTVFYIVDKSTSSIDKSYTTLLQNMAAGAPEEKGKSVVVDLHGKSSFEVYETRLESGSTLEAGGVMESVLPLPRLIEVSGDTWGKLSTDSSAPVQSEEGVFGGSPESGFYMSQYRSVNREGIDSGLLGDGSFDFGGNDRDDHHQEIEWPRLEVAYSFTSI